VDYTERGESGEGGELKVSSRSPDGCFFFFF
jgi:hypothetical protein